MFGVQIFRIVVIIFIISANVLSCSEAPLQRIIPKIIKREGNTNGSNVMAKDTIRINLELAGDEKDPLDQIQISLKSVLEPDWKYYKTIKIESPTKFIWHYSVAALDTNGYQTLKFEIKSKNGAILIDTTRVNVLLPTAFRTISNLKFNDSYRYLYSIRGQTYNELLPENLRDSIDFIYYFDSTKSGNNAINLVSPSAIRNKNIYGSYSVEWAKVENNFRLTDLDPKKFKELPSQTDLSKIFEKSNSISNAFGIDIHITSPDTNTIYAFKRNSKYGLFRFERLAGNKNDLTGIVIKME